MIHEMNLDKASFDEMKSGRKTVELRLYDEKRSKLNINDIIVFTDTSGEGGRMVTRVKALYRYASYEELFAEIDPAKCGYEAGTSIKDAALGMRAYYSEEQEKKYGVLGIKVEYVPMTIAEEVEE